jgi:hypothetical protein
LGGFYCGLIGCDVVLKCHGLVSGQKKSRSVAAR